MNAVRCWLLGALVWCAGVLALNSIASVPFWDADPFYSDLPESSLTPGQVLMVCTVSLLASTGLLAGTARHGELSRRSIVVFGAIGVGGVAVILHGLFLAPIAAGDGNMLTRGDMESLVTGATWIAGLMSGFAVATLRPRDRALRLVLGVFVVLGSLLVAKALFERFVELPRTITYFESDRESILRAGGMDPGSSRAEIYERRLRSQQPTAWFGLANVLASFLAAMAMLLVVTATRTVREARAGSVSSGAAGFVVLWLVLTVLALWSTGSFGASGVLILVLGATVPILRFQRSGQWVMAHPGRAVASVGGLVLAGIVFRALVLPESIDRSVLFRWHYLVGTFRVWMENLVLGAGPGGFQDAYTRLKPPVSPENVQTPHVLVADWIGAYGLLGIAVVAGLIFWLWQAKPIDGAEEPAQKNSEKPLRAELAWCVLVAGSILLTALVVQWGVVGGVFDLLLVLLLAFGVGVGVLAVILSLWRRHPACLRWGALGGAAVLVGHGMFDVAPARASSAMLFWLLLGVSIGPLAGVAGRARRWSLPPLLVGLPLAGLIGWAGLNQTTQVEPVLAEAARATRAGEFEFFSATPLPPQMTGVQTYGNLDLYPSYQSRPSWLASALVRLRLQAQLDALGDGLTRVDAVADSIRILWPDSVEAQAGIAATLWAFRDDPEYGREYARLAARAAARAAQLAPHDVQPAYRAAFMLQQTGYPDEAFEFARRAVENQRQTRMDPLAGLNSEQIRYLQGEFADLFLRDSLDPATPVGGGPGSR